MALEFEILAPDDKPALLGVTHSEHRSVCESVLLEMGYKVHTASSHEDFLNRFAQFAYQVVILEDTFDGVTLEHNRSLSALQHMQMHQRRHAVIILVGEPFTTLNPIQAFQQSVHGVVHPQELVSMLGQIIQKTTNDNNLFLTAYRETLTRIAQGKI